MKADEFALTAKQEIEAVQRTFEMIVPMADTFAFMFYQRFFEKDPEARQLFHSDMAGQREKVMEMLALAIRSLDEPEEMIQALGMLGRRHLSYRVQPGHYTSMNEAIIGAMAESLGDQFTSGMRQAWEKALDTLTQIMLEAADPSYTSQHPDTT
jgi:hemoglobin-like flavoprotein